MKQCLVTIFIFAIALSPILSSEQNYSEKGSIEIGSTFAMKYGTDIIKNNKTSKANSLGTWQENSFEINTGLFVRYFFIDKIYLSFAPYFKYNYSNFVLDSIYGTRIEQYGISFSPIVYLGYTFHLSENIFLSINIGGGYKQSSYYHANQDKTEYQYWLLSTRPEIKYKFNSALISLGFYFEYSYMYAFSEKGYLFGLRYYAPHFTYWTIPLGFSITF